MDGTDGIATNNAGQTYARIVLTPDTFSLEGPCSNQSSFESIIEFRRRLKDGQLLLDPAIYMTDPQSSKALADSAAFLWYYLEHQPMSLEALIAHLMIARLKNTPGIVRVPGPGPENLKPLLDIGAHGIVAPQIRSVEEV